MKRLFLTLSCIISIIWLYPCFVHASYTAPDGNDYKFKITSYPDGSGDYYTYYSNNKMCFCDAYGWGGGLYFPLGYEKLSDVDYIGSLEVSSGTSNVYFKSVYPSVSHNTITSDYLVFYKDQYPGNTNGGMICDSSQNPDIQIFTTYSDAMTYLTTPDVDFDYLYYDPTIPTPNFVVTLERPTPWNEVNTMTNFFDVVWNDNASYYVEIGYKYAVPNSMQVGLSEGNVIYTPLTYYESNYRNIYELSDLHVASGLNNDVNSSDFLWSAVQITDPSDWSTTVPVWANSYNVWQGKRDNWNNKLAYCMPLYGLRLEIFARYFYVLDSKVYVGAWKHWNNSYPNQYGEELPDNYQVGNSMPGYENTNNNVDYQDQTNTITSIGTQTGQDNTPTVIVNNLTPNYPDYPTVATYNHDNVLLQFISTAKALPQFFGDFNGFLAAAFSFIPSVVWSVIAIGFLSSIIIMIVKVL